MGPFYKNKCLAAQRLTHSSMFSVFIHFIKVHRNRKNIFGIIRKHPKSVLLNSFYFITTFPPHFIGSETTAIRRAARFLGSEG